MSGFPHRALLAVDGSAHSDLAMDRAVDLVQASGGELHVVHVGLVSPWTNPKTLNPEQRSRMEDEAGMVLTTVTDALESRGTHPVPHLRLGRAVDQVLALRDEIDADLVVLGSRGLNTFTRVLLGSDAESIVRHAPCPVLIVRNDR